MRPSRCVDPPIGGDATGQSPAQLVSQALAFFVLLFSPITFPAAQHTADGRDLLVLGLRGLLGVGLSVRTLVRRA